MNDSYSEKLLPGHSTHSTVLGVHEIPSTADHDVEDMPKRPRLTEYNFL